MITKEYKISLDKKTPTECYNKFKTEYREFLEDNVHENERTYFYYGTRAIIRNFEKEVVLRENKICKLNLINEIDNSNDIEEFLKDIKSKGFTLEEIVKK